MVDAELVTSGMANGGEAVEGSTAGWCSSGVRCRGAVRVRIVDRSNDRFGGPWPRRSSNRRMIGCHRRARPQHTVAGCCDLSFVEPVAGRRLKTGVTADVLRRIGSLTDPQWRESGFFADGVQALGPMGRAGGYAPGCSPTTRGGLGCTPGTRAR